MLKNYLTAAFRNIRKRKIYSFINITGLAVSFTAFTLIMLWVKYELSYDRYNKNADRIYRISTYIRQDNGGIDMAMTPPPLSAALKQLPEVSKVVRIVGPGKNVVVKYNNNLFNENNLFFAGSSLFQIFSFPLLNGNNINALKNPYSIVISRSMAKKFFGMQNPTGKSLNIKWYGNQHMFLITGVMKDIPANSHIHADFFASLSTLESLNHNFNKGWLGVSLYTYVLLSKVSLFNEFNKDLSGIIKQYAGEETARYWSLHAQKITSIHLHSHRLLEIEPNGNASNIYIFTTAGILILFIAIINFISLSIAGFTDRMKEVGVRKVLGAERKNLLIQFMMENFIFILIALLSAVSLVEIFMPYFINLLGEPLKFTFNSSVIILITGLALTTAGASYPAYFLSSFSPIRALNKNTIVKTGGFTFRKSLIVFQFAAATALIMCSVFMDNQMHYVMKKNLGININNVAYIPMMHPDVRAKYSVLRARLLNLQGVQNVSASTSNPSNMNMINSLYYNGKPILGIKNIGVDYAFIKTMGLHLIEGRNFSPQIPTDTNASIIINLAAAQKLKSMKLLDKQFEFHFNTYVRKGIKVIGIINNYNYRPLYYPVEPLIMYLKPGDYRYVEIKISGVNIPETINKIKSTWKSILPNYPINISFLDKDLKKEYNIDNKTESIFSIFSALGIFIGCLGLFGLSSYMVEKRTKEIGIRKVLGSSVKGIIILLSKDFLVLVTVSGLLAVPASFYFMQNWLEQFAYKIKINPFVFVWTILAVTVISFLTVGYHAFKAATANPIKSLRYE